MRLVLDAEVQGGKTSAANASLPRRIPLLKALPPEPRPRRVRGDSAFGNQPVMAELELIEQKYLFTLRQTAGVKRRIERQWSRHDGKDIGQGVSRRRVESQTGGRARCATGTREKRPQSLHFADPLEPVKLWAYAVLVTNAEYELEAIGPLYRDRADGENGFDALKNPWGWGGDTTQDRERCNLSARAVALVYNGGRGYVRLAHPQTRREASTSRPLRLAGVARLTEHAGQSRLLRTLTHAASDQIKSMVANVRKGLDAVIATAPQWTKPARWQALVQYLIARIRAAKLTCHLKSHLTSEGAPMLSPLIATG